MCLLINLTYLSRLCCSVRMLLCLYCFATVQRGSSSLRGRFGGSVSAAAGSFCPLTARAQRRRERERREEEQQRRKREGQEENRREGHQRHHLRPRQLSLQVKRTDKVCSFFPHTLLSEIVSPRVIVAQEVTAVHLSDDTWFQTRVPRTHVIV